MSKDKFNPFNIKHQWEKCWQKL